MNLDQTMAIRVAIRDTLDQLRPPVMGAGLSPDTTAALQDHLEALLKEELRALTGQALEGNLAGETDERDYVIAEAYQVVGQLLQDVGLFDSTRGTKILDNLAQARIVHEDVLPWATSRAEATDPQDGWIDWSGGTCPVPAETQVEIKLREGSTDKSTAGNWAWDHIGQESDIVRYRVCE